MRRDYVDLYTIHKAFFWIITTDLLHKRIMEPMDIENGENKQNELPKTDLLSAILGISSILFIIVYWILRAASYDYTDFIYITADAEYGKYFGVAFDTVCGILPALLIGIPLLIKAFWHRSRRQSQFAEVQNED
jgi:hypothetical protein